MSGHFTIVVPRKQPAINRTQYFENMMVGQDDKYKLMQRKLVNMFLSNHTKVEDGHRPRYLTLPGGTWAFERSFVTGQNVNPFFIGLEKHPTIFDQSLKWMPGCHRHIVTMEYTEPRGTIHTVRSEDATHIHCHLSALVMSVARAKLISQHYSRLHGMWLDFHSSLCDEVADSLPLVDTLLHHKNMAAPVIISLMGAREPSRYSVRSLDRSRASAIMLLLNKSKTRRYEAVDVFSYVNSNGTRMETLFALAKV